MNDLTVAEIKRRIVEVFPRMPPPGRDEITGHRCEECDDVRDDFGGAEWWTLGDEIVYNNFGQLPLFTPTAYQYYLPSYLLAALEPRDDDAVLEFLIYSWSPGNEESRSFLAERKALLTTDQKSLIRFVLGEVIKDEQLIYHHKDAESALKFYSELN